MRASTFLAGLLTAAAGARAAAPEGFLRGVNIGSWLILEKWMTPWVFDISPDTHDEYTLCERLGPDACRSHLESHWGSDWFNRDVVFQLKDAGINALRIPVGFWAFDNANTPYVQGSAEWLDKAIGWAREAGMKVWVDLHGAPGSQNGFDNSGRAGPVEWQQGDNIERTRSVLRTMAQRYGTREYADVVAAIQLINEPISWGANKFETTYQFAVDAYWSVRENAENPNLMVVMHDAFNGLNSWQPWPDRLGAGNPDMALVGLDTHMYQVFVPEDKVLTQQQHIDKVCQQWAPTLRESSGFAKTFVGEWSAATDICAFPDGHTEPGMTCAVDGCHCQANTGSPHWGPAMIDAVRKYFEAQLEAFEENAAGFFFWSFKGPGAWSFLDGVKYGWIPQPLDARKYPGQCQNLGKRELGGSRVVKRS